jgi:hypothetical protein
VTFRVTCEPGYFAERGLGGAFGRANDGRIGPDGTPRDFLTLALLSLGVSLLATARVRDPTYRISR